MPPNNTNPNYSQPPTSQTGFDPNMPIAKPKKHINTLLIPLIIAIILLIGVIVFGAWAYMERQSYKNDVDQKINQAVATANEQKSKEKDAEFEEKEKQPYKTYSGPAAFGSLKLTYPKTWSAYVVSSDKGSTPIDGYFHPNVVPGLESNTAYALHVQVTNTAYDQELKKFDSDAKAGKVTVSAILAPKVPTVAGVRIDGQVVKDKQGILVLFPLRDKTLKISTESVDYSKDFIDIILANLEFSP